MMDTAPKPITREEWAEIRELPIVTELWGLTDDTAEEFSRTVYGVRYDFVSGSPGYVGDVFILMGDALTQPVTLIRQEGNLIKLE